MTLTFLFLMLESYIYGISFCSPMSTECITNSFTYKNSNGIAVGLYMYMGIIVFIQIKGNIMTHFWKPWLHIGFKQFVDSMNSWST